MKLRLPRLRLPWAAKPKAGEGPQWRALPGNQLELGATGFRIVMTPHAEDGVRCRLYNPEGVVVAHGQDYRLQALKSLGEECAASRGEFDAQPVLWWGPW